MTQPLSFTTHACPFGTLLIVGGARGVRYLTLLAKTEEAATHLARVFGAEEAGKMLDLPGFFDTSLAAIDAYLTTGAPLKLPYALDSGTALQRAVWLAIAKIPYGETISYTTLAERVGFPRAVRAVASACGANPVPLIIPCHRVLAKDGALGGFSFGGPEVKERLLALESQKRQMAA